MDHRAIIASLSPDQRAGLTEKADRPGLVHLALHWGLIAALAMLIARRVPFWPLLLLPQGILIVFLFTLLHEAIHGTPFRSPWLNRFVERVCGFLLILPPDWFRFFHLAHHRHTQDPERDPELASPKPETFVQYAWHVSGLPVWWGEIKGLFLNAAGRNEADYVPPKGKPKVIREARLMIGLYAVLIAGSIALQSTLLLWIWVVPALLGQPFLRLYLLAEHGRCPFVANMLENTRTTRTNWLVRKLAWNMPYHAEHHAYPGVPFHRLPQFHAIVDKHLREVEDGYARFNRKYVAGLTR